MEPNYVNSILFTHVLPYLAFFSGVIFSGKAGLYPSIKPSHLAFLSIPAGLIITGLLINIASVTIQDITYFGYTAEIHKYLFFIGVLMIYGTVAPDSFLVLRKRFSQPK